VLEVADIYCCEGGRTVQDPYSPYNKKVGTKLRQFEGTKFRGSLRGISC
jgi:hypothetical protein